MTLRALLALLIAFQVLVEPAFALPASLRVQLLESRSGIKRIELIGPFEITSPVRKRFGKEMISVVVNGSKLDVVRASSTRYGSRAARAANKILSANRVVVSAIDPNGTKLGAGVKLQRRYGGSLSMSIENGELKVLNEVPTRQYLASVVGSEAPLHCPPEALKALALLALMIVDPKKSGEVVGDSTREQAYKGSEYITASTQSAVAAVFQKRLFYNDSPAQVFYHSTCAGGTSSGADIFGAGAQGLKYLQPVKCTFCNSSPFWKEKVGSLPLSSFLSILNIHRLPAITKFDSANRPVVIGNMSGYETWVKLGRARGWGFIPGMRYRYDISSSAGQKTVRVVSSGAGHGVGLCQWGAAGLARQGKSMEQILEFYFPGCKLVTLRE